MISEEKLEQAKRFMSTLEYLSEEEIQRFVDVVYGMAWMNRLLAENRNKKKQQLA